MAEFDEQKKREIVELYAEMNVPNIAEIARIFGTTPEMIQSLRSINHDMDIQMRHTELLLAYRLENKLYERAVKGWKEPVYQSGAMVGYKERFCSKSLHLMVKRYNPEYRNTDYVPPKPADNPSATRALLENAPVEDVLSLRRTLERMAKQKEEAENRAVRH